MYYAVINGKTRHKAIFMSWDECKEEVTGAKGVQFKKFSTLREAQNFISNKAVKLTDINLEDGVTIYTDGSYSDKCYGYGFVVFKDGKQIYEDCGSGSDKEWMSSRNIAGEILAVLCASEYCIHNNIKEIKLVYDYEGLGAWATGRFQARTAIAKTYVNIIAKVQERINITWIKVKGHTGTLGNEIADSLAKKGAGID